MDTTHRIVLFVVSFDLSQHFTLIDSEECGNFSNVLFHNCDFLYIELATVQNGSYSVYPITGDDDRGENNCPYTVKFLTSILSCLFCTMMDTLNISSYIL